MQSGAVRVEREEGRALVAALRIQRLGPNLEATAESTDSAAAVTYGPIPSPARTMMSAFMI